MRRIRFPLKSIRRPCEAGLGVNGNSGNAEVSSYDGLAGSNMHCSVGLAILVKVAEICDCFDGGTQSVSIVGTPVSLMPRSSASRRSLSSTVAAAWSCRQPHTDFRMLPAPDHVRGAGANEIGARIGKFEG